MRYGARPRRAFRVFFIGKNLAKKSSEKYKNSAKIGDKKAAEIRRLASPRGIVVNFKANRRKGQCHFFNTLPEVNNSDFLFMRAASMRNLSRPFYISISRNRKSPPNCPTISCSGYVQTVA